MFKYMFDAINRKILICLKIFSICYLRTRKNHNLQLNFLLYFQKFVYFCYRLSGTEKPGSRKVSSQSFLLMLYSHFFGNVKDCWKYL